MKKSIQRPDNFEKAVMKTLSKVNRVGNHVNGVTIGPNCILSEPDANNSLEAYDKIMPNTFNKEVINGRKMTVNDSDEENEVNSISYAMKALHDMENLRRISVNDNISEHISHLMNIEENLRYRMNESLKLTKEKMINKNKLKPKIIESSIRNEDLIISQKMHQLMKRYSDNLKQEDKAAMEANARAAEEEIVLKNERIQQLCDIEKQYRTVHEEIINSTVCCKNRSKLTTLVDADFQKIEQFNNILSSIIEKVDMGDIEDVDVETCRTMLRDISAISCRLKDYVDQINAGEDADQAFSIHQQSDKMNKNVPMTRMEEVDNIATESNTAVNRVTDLDKCVCKECLDVYIVFNENLTEFSKEVKLFVDKVSSTKSLRKLKIAISTPINALSSFSTSHMKDKFVKITHFLRGNFTLTNASLPNIPRESYFVFVVDYLCRQFINHAGKLFIPSKPHEAFLLGSLVVALWVDFPNFGTILLANIMQECPYTIPAYWPRQEGQSDQEYYISIGYQYKNNEIEDELAFLSRMTGIFMLYIAIITTNAPRNKPHPYGMENAWRWIAATLNLEPRANITPALLHVFLEMCGFKLSQYYGMQFWKLLHLLSSEYYPKIETMTSPDLRGPVSRLKTYLENVLRTGFKEPNGVLGTDFWQ